MTIASSTPHEVPVFFPCERNDMFGVLTHPVSSEARGVVVLFLWGAGGLPSFGKNQLLARLAHRAASAGYHAMRIDYPGSGESSGSVAGYRLDDPLLSEVRAACSWLGGKGLHRVALVGSCSGARTALAAASQVPEVSAVGLLSPPVLDQTREETEALKRALASGTEPEWASPHFLDQVEEAFERGIPVLLVYGKGDKLYTEFERARTGRLGRLLEQGSPLRTVRLLEGSVHADPSVEGQDRVIDVLGRWLSELPDAPPSPGADA